MSDAWDQDATPRGGLGPPSRPGAAGPFGDPGAGSRDSAGAASADARPFAAPEAAAGSPIGTPPGAGPWGAPGDGPFGGAGGAPGPFRVPHGRPAGYAPYGSIPGYGYAGPPQTDSGARHSLILAIVGIFVCGLVLGPAAIVEGLKARKRIRFSNGRLTGDGLAIAGIAIGSLIVAVTVVSLVIVIVVSAKQPSSRLR